MSVYWYNTLMHKSRIFLIVGIWIAVLPYLGFPYSWKNILFTLSGLGLIGFSYIIYRESKTKESAGSADGTFDNFSENRDFGEDKTVN